MTEKKKNFAGKYQEATEKHMPMVNIRFTPENYNFVKCEASLRGMSMTKFVNAVITEYQSQPEHVHENPLYQNVDPK